MSEKESKPLGSGCFSLAAGIAFLLLFVGSYLFDLKKVNPYQILQCWLVFAAAILTIWGGVRVAKARKAQPRRWEVGQSTLNFVVGVIAATAAIFTLVVERAG
jgi:uncharacterized membrane protein YfcA